MGGARTVARVGLISDTHGKLPAFAEEALAGVDHIAHAGDVGSALPVVWALESIAPLTLVMGNNHCDLPGYELEFVAMVTVAGKRIVVIHDFADLGPIPEGVDVVVCGHTHRPRCEWHGRTLVLNPGSPTRPRGGTPPSVAVLEISEDGGLEVLLVAEDEG